ncbi:hypothetical protein DXG01_007197 [Tephrocybe rancida]|nr:hypothetical protein DXG01_007197 [Tephrocybe rancida]
MSPSYQLPDLLSLCRPFELRTNPYCRPATIASESWLLALKTAKSDDVLTGAERASVHPAKFGLLAALCNPGCGQPQLFFFANFISILSIADSRLKSAQGGGGSGWLSDIEADGVETLSKHELFQYILPDLQRLVAKANSSWTTRFTQAVHSFHSAQLQIVSGQKHHVIPDLETYLPLRRDLSGLFLLLDLIEVTENLTLPSMNEQMLQKFTRMKHLALDIICCSLDVVSFNIDQVQGNHYNLISVLMTHNHLSLQGAVNLAGSMIKDMFDVFADSQISLFSPPTPPQPNQSGAFSLSSSWTWFRSSRFVDPAALSVPNLEVGGDLARLGDLPAYIQVLKDCIVGTINWAYETELYFGRKGEEIRTFGWVFLNSTADNQGLA